MPRSLPRFLYRCLLRLHPPSFQRQFAQQMLCIFDEAAAREGVVRLFADGLASLARQWLVRWALQKFLLGEIALARSPGLIPGLFAWEHIAVPETPLPASRIMQGSLISLLFLAAVSVAASHAGNTTPLRRFSVATGNSAHSQAFAGSRSQGFASDLGVRAGENLGASGATDNGGEEQINGQSGLAAQPQIPDTPPARQFSAWLDAFNSGDRASLLRFLEKNYPSRAANIDQELNFREMTGGFELRKPEESSSTRFTGIVQERDSDQFARFVIEVEPDELHRITRLDLQLIARPPDFPMPRMNEGAALAALRAELEKRVAADRFAGAVLVAKKDKPLFSGAYGLADREKKIPNKLTTRFRIGSMNKMFTAVAVLQLAQAGKIKLTDPIGKYLTDYPNKDLASKVTIHHLLTHTGGTGDFFGPEFDAHRLELRTLQDYVKLYGKRGLAFEPGSRWEYSNYGFLLLGVVIERVTGKNYYEYVQDYVYKPAGMISTGSLSEDEVVPERSIGYTKFGGGKTWRPNTDTLPYRGTSAGGGYSTVEDLLRFANALENHTLLDAHYSELLTSGKVDTPNGAKYAYGFMDRNVHGVRSFGHGGGAPGMNGDLEIYPESGYVIAVLANMDPPAAQRIADFIANRLPEK